MNTNLLHTKSKRSKRFKYQEKQKNGPGNVTNVCLVHDSNHQGEPLQKHFKIRYTTKKYQIHCINQEVDQEHTPIQTSGTHNL